MPLVSADLFSASPFPKVNWGSVVTERLEKTTDNSFEPLSVGKKGVTKQLESVAKAKNQSGRKIVRKGDIVINSRSDRRGASGISPREGAVSIVYSVMQPKLEVLSPGYAAYLLQSEVFQDTFYLAGVGIVDDLWSTSFNRMSSIRIPLPPLPTQHAIADYLDRETAEIDGMRADLDEMERLLAERREAIVADLLLKSPSVVYVSLGLLFTLEDHLRVPVKAGDRKEIAGNVPYYGASGVIDYVSKPIWADCTRLLVSEDGANLALRNHPIAFTASGDFWVNNHAHILRENQQDSYALAAAGISVTDISGFLSGSAQPKLTAESMSRIKVPWLDHPGERRSLVTEIDRETAEIDSMLEDITELRDLLVERRAAVISAAVTGQIDIPVSPIPKDEPHA